MGAAAASGLSSAALSCPTGALWLWEGDQAGVDDIAVNRAGDATCGVRVDLQTASGAPVRGVDASYDPEAGTLSIDLEPAFCDPWTDIDGRLLPIRYSAVSMEQQLQGRRIQGALSRVA